MYNSTDKLDHFVPLIKSKFELIENPLHVEFLEEIFVELGKRKKSVSVGPIHDSNRPGCSKVSYSFVSCSKRQKTALQTNFCQKFSKFPCVENSDSVKPETFDSSAVLQTSKLDDMKINTFDEITGDESQYKYETSDISELVGTKHSDERKIEMLSKNWAPKEDYEFPKDKDKRQFYSSSQDGVF